MLYAGDGVQFYHTSYMRFQVTRGTLSPGLWREGWGAGTSKTTASGRGYSVRSAQTVAREGPGSLQFLELPSLTSRRRCRTDDVNIILTTARANRNEYCRPGDSELIGQHSRRDRFGCTVVSVLDAGSGPYLADAPVGWDGYRPSRQLHNRRQGLAAGHVDRVGRDWVRTSTACCCGFCPLRGCRY